MFNVHGCIFYRLGFRVSSVFSNHLGCLSFDLMGCLGFYFGLIMLLKHMFRIENSVTIKMKGGDNIIFVGTYLLFYGRKKKENS